MGVATCSIRHYSAFIGSPIVEGLALGFSSGLG